ncbi:LysM peptidoglycan-binding domain-containing protein [Candidatus Pacearchaeota archaeon]|nr:LysM peptidoglycan-binding domain-containing protein [Candidatus Pacearchaeota archaeon]
MPIKSTYIVKPNDRASFIAKNYNITVQQLQNANPQIFTPARIAKTNELIANQTLNPGELLIFQGEELNIPTGLVDEIAEQQTIRADSADELTILINGNKCPLPHEFRFTEYFDTCSDSFEITYPYNPDLQNPAYLVKVEDFRTKGLPQIKIYIGDDPVLTGEIEIPANKITPDSVIQTIGGRSKTYLLEKSDMFPSIPREFLNLTLNDIAPQIANVYSISVEIADNVDLSEPFEKVTAEDNEKPFFFLSRLARERSAILGKTGEGKLLIHKAVKQDPVANFVIETIDGELRVGTAGQFIGVEGLEFTFDTSELFGQYIGKTTGINNPNLTSTIQSKVLKQQSIKVTNYSDANEKTLDSMTEWEEQKAVREFYKNAIPFPDWINPNNGIRWKKGDFVTLQAVEAGIDQPQIMLIRQIDFTKDNTDKRMALLKIIPSEVYL